MTDEIVIKYERYTDPEVVLDNMVEIDFLESSEDGFRKVKETLQRIGVQKRGYYDDDDNFIEENILVQSCHIFHKRGKYYICHFKEMFGMDGNYANISEQDLGRRNLVVKYLQEWNMIKPISDNWEEPMGHPRLLKVIKYSELDNWVLESKYQIGTKV